VVKPTYLRPVPRDATDEFDVARPDPLVGLVSRCQGGDEAAWAELYRQESPRVARFLRRFLGPHRETDDAIQQVFVELFTSLPRFRGDARPTTWIFRIAANVALNRLRSERRRDRRAAALLDWLLGAPGVTAGPGPDAEVAARQELRQLAAAVDVLPVGHRLVWLLREVEELSTEEVAAALELEPGTVRSRLHHARRKVMARLDKERKRVR
jgi:RNA polymerase sigma-70 factor (ECF subfamily)